MKVKTAKKLFFAIAFILFFSNSFSVQAKESTKVIDLPYLKFRVPSSWTCQTEKTETICKSPQGSENKQAVILINAKETTPVETMEAFYQQLSQPKGLGTVKKIEYIKTTDGKWIQAHHSGSELPNYDTIYWMIRAQNIAVLVTYSFLAKYSDNLYPLGQNIPKSFQLNTKEITRLSQIAQANHNAQAQQNQITELPKEALQTPSKEPATFKEKALNLIKSPYALIFIALCVIIAAFTLFLR